MYLRSGLQTISGYLHRGSSVFGFKSYLRIVTVNVMRSVVCCEMCEFFIYSKTTFAQLLTKIFQKGICVTFVFISVPFGFKTFALFSTSLFSRCCDILEIHSFCQNQMVTWNTILLYHHLIWKLGFMKIRVCYYRHIKASLLWMFQLKSNKLVPFSAQKLCNCCAALSNVG